MKIQIAKYNRYYDHDPWGADGTVDVYPDKEVVVLETPGERIVVDRRELTAALRAIATGEKWPT